MTDQDPIVTALLAERDRALTDDHRQQIDHELRERGYRDPAAKTEKASEPDKSAEKRAAAQDRTTPPEGRTTGRGKTSG